jgi:hypothetical protein
MYIYATLLSTYSPRHDNHSIVIRKIDVPDADPKHTIDEIFEAAFTHGQNDFQPREMCSVSVGDLITVVEDDFSNERTRKVENSGFGPCLSVREVLRMKLQTRREANYRENS